MNMTSDIVLETKGLTKAFGGNAVLKGVDITLRRGEVVLLQGANGSGKTTLMNMLAGIYFPDEGEILQVEKHSIDELVSMCMNGEIIDAKTVIAVLKAKRILNIE